VNAASASTKSNLELVTIVFSLLPIPFNMAEIIAKDLDFTSLKDSIAIITGNQ
jgi:hypothetical protein